MPLNGAGCRMVGSPSDFGDLFAITVAVQPTGTYPTNGEDVAALLADTLMGDLVKQYVGVKPVNVLIGNDNLGHPWSYDPALLTMGALRNWTVLGATPTEHTNVGYDPGESAAVFRITFYFPKFRTSTA